MKSIHDLIAEFEAEVASLFTKFRSMVAAHSSPAAATADPPADFGPIPPDGSAVPPSKPAEPPAAPAPQPETPRPVNTTDPTAPGFVMPANPQPAPAPADPGPDLFSDVFDWNASARGSAIPLFFRGPNGRKTFTVPDGYVGFFRLYVSESPDTKGGNGWVCTVNGMWPRQQPSGNGDYTHEVYVGMPVANPNDPRQHAGVPGAYAYEIQSEGGGVAALRRYP